MDILIPSATRADALMIPEQFKFGESQPERVCSIDRIADPLLGVDRRAHETNYQRCASIGGMIFVTKNACDMLKFPKRPIRHPLAGQPRYNWVDGPMGIKLGYLTEAARADLGATEEKRNP